MKKLLLIALLIFAGCSPKLTPHGVPVTSEYHSLRVETPKTIGWSIVGFAFLIGFIIVSSK